MEAGEVNIVGINDGAFLACSATIMATEIANVYIDEISIENLESPTLAKTSAISTFLTQKPSTDFAKMAEQEEKEMTDILEQTISVSRAAPLERLLTISLLRLARFDKIRISAAGGSINDAVALALKLTRGQSRIKLDSFLARPWQLSEVMENDLESVTLASYPVLVEIKGWLLQNGALGALMSGSGPTVFGVFRKKSQADRIGALAERRWRECWVAVAQVRGNAAAKTE